MEIVPDYVWKINDMERVCSDGCVTKVFWVLEASYVQSVGVGTTSIEEKVYKVSTVGSSSLGEPNEDDFIPFKNLSEEIVLQWVMDDLNRVDGHIDALKNDLKMQIERSIQPVKVFGIPWSSETND